MMAAALGFLCAMVGVILGMLLAAILSANHERDGEQ